MRVVFDHYEAEADNIWTFYFRTDEPVHYTAGQFIELTVPHDNPDERRIKHWFTLSSSPSDDLLSITTKFASGKSSTFKTALKSLEEGTELHMSSPMGDFVLPRQLDTPLVFVAGGIGITPYLSMLSWLTSTGEQRQINLLYAVRNEDEIIREDLLKASGAHVTIIVEQPSDAWGGERGQLSAELILGIEEPDPRTFIYLSGPEPMTEKLAHELVHSGFKKQQLVTDYFPGYTQF